MAVFGSQTIELMTVCSGSAGAGAGMGALAGFLLRRYKPATFSV
jgi:hypothetical protein